MAYARWTRTSEWYIFWEASPARSRSEQRLAVWRANPPVGLDGRPYVTYGQVRTMLAAGDFSSVPGYTAKDHAILSDALTEFAQDVESDSSLSAD